MKSIRTLAWSSRNRLIERMATWGDRFLYKSHVSWWANRAWTEQYLPYLRIDARPGYDETRILDRRYSLIQFANSVRERRGHTAECGVFRGVASALICQTLAHDYRDGERHYGFDAWEGLPAPTEQDRTSSGTHWWKEGALAVSMENAQQLLAPFPFCTLKRGWIPASFTGFEELQWRFVHIDLDLHEPTRDALEFFYPRMIHGGILFFDDYGLESCPGARTAVDNFFQGKPETVVALTTGQGFVMVDRHQS